MSGRLGCHYKIPILLPNVRRPMLVARLLPCSLASPVSWLPPTTICFPIGQMRPERGGNSGLLALSLVSRSLLPKFPLSFIWMAARRIPETMNSFRSRRPRNSRTELVPSSPICKTVQEKRPEARLLLFLALLLHYKSTHLHSLVQRESKSMNARQFCPASRKLFPLKYYTRESNSNINSHGRGRERGGRTLLQKPTQVRFWIYLKIKIPKEYDYRMPRLPENKKIKIPQVGSLTNKFQK